MTTYRTTANQRINLGTELAKGGEGIVFDVQGDQRIVAKIYHDSKLKTGNELEAKLQAMLVNPPQDQAIVWPTDLLYDGKKFVGYLMPRLHQTINLFELYNPQQRQTKFPGTDWKYLHAVARNLAAAFLVLHQASYVMGDVNQKNVLVEANGIIRLVDTDSFQVRDRNGRIFRCSVGVPDYTPPEMCHKDLSKIDRNTNQDAFGLGVLIFQLLMEGFHPFSGAPKNPAFSVQQPIMEYCIEHGIFPYDSKSQNSYDPPPNAHDFTSLHPAVQKLFIKCFIGGHSDPSSRPSAAEWYNALGVARDDLKQCATDKTHWYFPSTGNCPWYVSKAKYAPSIPLPPTLRPVIPPPPAFRPNFPRQNQVNVPPKSSLIVGSTSKIIFRIVISVACVVLGLNVGAILGVDGAGGFGIGGIILGAIIGIILVVIAIIASIPTLGLLLIPIGNSGVIQSIIDFFIPIGDLLSIPLLAGLGWLVAGLIIGLFD